jgi:hypothetical protein
MSFDRPERPEEEITPTYKASDTYRGLLARLRQCPMVQQASTALHDGCLLSQLSIAHGQVWLKWALTSLEDACVA